MINDCAIFDGGIAQSVTFTLIARYGVCLWLVTKCQDSG